jgi:hypothetical protein
MTSVVLQIPETLKILTGTIKTTAPDPTNWETALSVGGTVLKGITTMGFAGCTAIWVGLNSMWYGSFTKGAEASVDQGINLVGKKLLVPGAKQFVASTYELAKEELKNAKDNIWTPPPANATGLVEFCATGVSGSSMSTKILATSALATLVFAYLNRVALKEQWNEVSQKVKELASSWQKTPKDMVGNPSAISSAKGKQPPRMRKTALTTTDAQQV